MTRAASGSFLALAVVLALAPRDGQAGPIEDPGCSTVLVVERSDQVLYPLPRAWLGANGDSAWSATRHFVRGQDYALDLTRGLLSLRVPPVPGETLWVRVCGLIDPPALEAHYAVYRPAPTAASDTIRADSTADPVAMARPGAQRSTTEAPPGTSIAIQGNKTIAVDFGSNQDAFLRQSLDLAVSGTLAPGVELTGVLSDRNTPLTTTGSTKDLQSLDRLLIELKAPQGGAALGDMSLSLDQGEFGRIDRRLQGVRAEWSGAGVTGVAAAASAEGEFQRIEFYGVEGQQGPYTLSGSNGLASLPVVAGSEIVTLDGVRMTRGEGADYSMDYDRAELTFTNRRPIGASSRITVECQIAVNRFRRNLAAVGARWGQGPWRLSTTALSEGDDRGRPLAASLDPSDRLALSAAGDSSSHAIGSGVTPGGGDYDLVVVGSQGHYAFAGPDSGAYAVAFTAVPQGQGDYVDSVLVAGRIAYRWVGPGQGLYKVGRRLPLPDSHQLWNVTSGIHLGILDVDVEGAISRLDRNTFSTLDDGDDVGHAARAGLKLEGRSPGWLGGTMGMGATTRTVEPRFQPFTQLQAPFEQEDWGMAPGTSLDSQIRHEATAFVRPGLGGELRGTLGHLSTPSGFASLRRQVLWDHDGRWVTRARWERADGEDHTRAYSDGGRDRRLAELGFRFPRLESSVRADWDERWSPSDTMRTGVRSREVGADLKSGAAWPWRLAVGAALRRDGSLEPFGYRDLYDTRTGQASLQTPEGRAWTTAIAWQHRAQIVLGPATRTVSDLGSVRVSGRDAARGWNTVVGLEVTSQGESERSRQLTFLGPGLGAYDSLGNFVGAGNGGYTMAIVTGALARIARAAGTVRLGWQPPAAGDWRGSRADLVLETEARRRGALRGGDAWLSPGTALEDGELAFGQVTQRLEAEVMPGARVGALSLRLERRVSADRSFTNFAQTQDQRTGSARLRARAAAGWTAEVEGRLKQQSAEQDLGAAALARSQREVGLLAQLGYTPHARLRAALVSDIAWTRDDVIAALWSKVWRFGPELGLSVLQRGRVELSARRALATGPTVLPILPNADPIGLVLWETSARFDYRLGEQTTFGLSMITRNREGHGPEQEGRAEARAFF